MIERTLGFVATVCVAAVAGRQSAGLPQDRDHAGRARDPDLRR
jgi:hypothetical protein